MPEPTRHKITIYLTEAELYALDVSVVEVRRRTHTRTTRSRYVREALAMGSLGKIAQRIREAS